MELKRIFSLSPSCFLLFLFISSASLVRSQSDSCSSKLSVSNQIPFNTTSLSCFNAWSSQDFILRYGKAGGSNVWSFVLSAPDTGTYVSIGFSPSGMMVGSSAMAGWVSGGSGSAKQYYLGGTSSTSCPPDQGNLKLVQGSTVLVSRNSRMYLAFQVSATPLQNVIYAVGPSNSLPNSGGYLPQHKSMASGTISLSGGGGAGGNTTNGGRGGDGDGDGDGDNNRGTTRGGDDSGEHENGDNNGGNDNSSASRSGGSSLSSARRHGLLVMIGWGILMPIGIGMAQFFKQCDPFWFYAHITVQIIGFVSGIVGIFAGFGLDDDAPGGSADTHKALGIVILVCGCLQVMALLARPTKEAKLRKYWNWYHHYVGRCAIILVIANIFYGFSIAEENKSWTYSYGILIGIFAVLYLVLEEWRRKHS